MAEKLFQSIVESYLGSLENANYSEDGDSSQNDDVEDDASYNDLRSAIDEYESRREEYQIDDETIPFGSFTENVYHTNNQSMEDLDFLEFVRKHRDLQKESARSGRISNIHSPPRISTETSPKTDEYHRLGAAKAEIRSLKTQLKATKQKLNEKDAQTKKLSDELQRKSQQYYQTLYDLTAKAKPTPPSNRKRPKSVASKRSPAKKSGGNISFDSSLPATKRGFSSSILEREIENLDRFEEQLRGETRKEKASVHKGQEILKVESPQLRDQSSKKKPAPEVKTVQNLQEQLTSVLKEKDIMEVQFEKLLQHTQTLATTVSSLRSQNQNRSIPVSPTSTSAANRESPTSILSKILVNASTIQSKDLEEQQVQVISASQNTEPALRSSRSLPTSTRRAKQKAPSTKTFTAIKSLRDKIHDIKEKYLEENNEERRKKEKGEIVTSITNLMNKLLESEDVNTTDSREKVEILTETLRSFIIEEIEAEEKPVQLPSPIKQKVSVPASKPVTPSRSKQNTSNVAEKLKSPPVQNEKILEQQQVKQNELDEKTRTLKKLLGENLTMKYDLAELRKERENYRQIIKESDELISSLREQLERNQHDHTEQIKEMKKSFEKQLTDILHEKEQEFIIASHNIQQHAHSEIQRIINQFFAEQRKLEHSRQTFEIRDQQQRMDMIRERERDIDKIYDTLKPTFTLFQTIEQIESSSQYVAEAHNDAEEEGEGVSEDGNENDEIEIDINDINLPLSSRLDYSGSDDGHASVDFEFNGVNAEREQGEEPEEGNLEHEEYENSEEDSHKGSEDQDDQHLHLELPGIENMSDFSGLDDQLLKELEHTDEGEHSESDQNDEDYI